MSFGRWDAPPATPSSFDFGGFGAPKIGYRPPSSSAYSTTPPPSFGGFGRFGGSGGSIFGNAPAFVFGEGDPSSVFSTPRVLSIEETIAVFTKAVEAPPDASAVEADGGQQQQPSLFGAPLAAPAPGFNFDSGFGSERTLHAAGGNANMFGGKAAKPFRKIPGQEPPPFLCIKNLRPLAKTEETTTTTTTTETEAAEVDSSSSSSSPPPPFILSPPQGEGLEKGEKACDTVVKALLITTHKRSEQVVKQACWAIFTLAKRSADNTRRLGALGACQVLVEILENHLSASSQVVWYVCTALGFLATDAANRTKLVEQTVSCLALLVEAIKTHAYHEGVCVAVCWCMANLALDESHCARLGQAGACQCAVQAMRAHCNRSSLVVEKASWTIINLACSARGRALHAGLLRQAGATALLSSIVARRADGDSCLSEAALSKAQEALALL